MDLKDADFQILNNYDINNKKQINKHLDLLVVQESGLNLKVDRRHFRWLGRRKFKFSNFVHQESKLSSSQPHGNSEE